MVPFLSKQNLIFHIYVIEQTKKGLFNRGKLRYCAGEKKSREPILLRKTSV